ncbi:MAG: 50S ribosomal protein L28 [Candidatus Saccharimonadales bacterium]
MAHRCEITDKGKQFGHNVSFSQRKTKKVWKPNLHKQTFLLDGEKVTMKVSAQGLRTLKKQGRYQTINSAKSEELS